MRLKILLLAQSILFQDPAVTEDYVEYNSLQFCLLEPLRTPPNLHHTGENKQYAVLIKYGSDLKWTKLIFKAFSKLTLYSIHKKNENTIHIPKIIFPRNGKQNEGTLRIEKHNLSVKPVKHFCYELMYRIYMHNVRLTFLTDVTAITLTYAKML